MSFKIGQESQGSLDRLIDANYAVDRISVFADFYFSHDPAGDPALSSGEYAIYMVFARLNDLKLDSHGKVKPLLMLIDEAEMALHPQWQKEFVFHFTEFIKIRFANYKVQVIFTSHSPFIVSDLPPNCILFLKKDLNHTVVEHGLKRANATFGANIHELFTDAFFLRDGLIGEFARRKIENLVSRVSEKSEYDQFEYVNLKKEIDIIGEPYVRYKLLEKIMNGLSDKEFDKVIEERESELEKLKNTRGDKNPG